MHSFYNTVTLLPVKSPGVSDVSSSRPWNEPQMVSKLPYMDTFNPVDLECSSYRTSVHITLFHVIKEYLYLWRRMLY